MFNKSNYEVIIYATQKPRDAYEKAKEYAEQVDLIVCSGGDGTLDEVVTGIMEMNSSVPVGYIPAGSTNDFANSLFMPKDMTEVASMIMEEELYRQIRETNLYLYCCIRSVYGCFLRNRSGSEKHSGSCGISSGRNETPV